MHANMFVYWCLFLLPATLAIRRKRAYLPHAHKRGTSPSWFFALLALTLIVGLRHEVGGDWGNYLPYVQEAGSKTLYEIWENADPAYGFFNWIGSNFGGGIYTVNTLCSLLFSIGLIAFAKQLPRPSLALAVAAPYLILVVAMGYSRQGVALGIALLGLSYLQRGGLWKFVLSICVAALFHKSAIVLILFALTAKSKHRILTGISVLAIGAGLYLLLAVEAVDTLKGGYIEAEYQSAGAGVRVAMNALPAFIFLWRRNKFQITSEQLRLWTVLSIIALAFVVILEFSPSSTAVDRVALYLIPLQLFVWSHFPDAFGKPGKRNTVRVIQVLLYYAAVLFVWLNYADNRDYWLPYKFYLLELL